VRSVAHSDHGSQYTSLLYGIYAKTSGIELSMGSIGDPWDNAVAETFFASLAKELIRRECFATREAARMRIFWYIECFYNTRRRHSRLGYLSPRRERSPSPTGGHRGIVARWSSPESTELGEDQSTEPGQFQVRIPPPPL
jgi:transposase InsO family protein